MTEQRRFLMMAGGTGGHVFPALATARALEEKGHQVYWLGASGGMEQRLIGETDIPLSLIHISGLRGKGKLALVLAPFRLMRALGEAFTIMRRIRPDCVVGMGGFVTGPGGAVRPTPSPDGKYLAFVRRVRNQSTLFLKDLQ
ncbi:glycosyltransferase, partial [Marinobacter sp.]|uniref:glycosyltransferase n=1 Tax=Marinobacter sp. TaxID=50741 RepID=UPI0035C6DA4A